MDPRGRALAFRRGLEAYRRGALDASVMEFRRLLKDGSTEPRHISYCGLLVAIAEGRTHDGRVLCELAVREAPDKPEMYLNLARVLARAEDRSRAVEVLREGLRVVPRAPALRQELERLSPRARPVLSFLNRSHPLNRYLGLRRARRFGAYLRHQ